MALLVIVLCTSAVSADELDAVVTYVVDGDSFKVLLADGKRAEVRLQGIDAPEYKQAYGQQSRASLLAILDQMPIRIDSKKRDRYGRLIAHVWVQPTDCKRCAKTLEAGLYQLTQGAAWYFRRFESELDEDTRGRYASAEQEARARKWGLWAAENPQAPWSWRKFHPRK